jgi:YggT family protein
MVLNCVLAITQTVCKPALAHGARQLFVPHAAPSSIELFDVRSVGKLGATAAVFLAPLAASAAELDSSAGEAALARAILDPFLSIMSLLFLIRIVLSWYPQYLNKMPYKALALPVEPFLRILRGVVEPIGGVDITPIVWLALCTFAKEVLVGPQGILTLVAQQKLG